MSNFLQMADEVVVLGETGRILMRGINAQNLHLHAERLSELGISVPGVPYAHVPRAKADRPREAVLSLRDAKCGYDGVEILRGATAEFYAGRMAAVTGPSGGGKSTLLMAIARMLKYRGTIELAGRDISRMPRRRYMGRIGIVYQNPQDQFVSNTVYDEIAVSVKARSAHGGAEARVREILEGLGLWKYRNFSPYMLSQGQQRRLAVGALLAYECDILLCDEPTYGQDRQSAEGIMNILVRRAREDGLAVIFTTHDMRLADAYGDDQYRCEGGRLWEVVKC